MIDHVDLVECLQRNDQKAWDFLVRMYYEDLVTFCSRYVHSSNEARDLVHDTFIKAKKKIQRFEQCTYGSIRPWLWRIARNTALDYIRYRNVREPDWQAPKIMESSATRAYLRIPDDKTGPRTSARKQEEYHRLFESLEQLDPIHHEIVCLRYIDQFSRKEIATYLGIPENTVKSRLRVALKNLRTMLPRSMYETS